MKILIQVGVVLTASFILNFSSKSQEYPKKKKEEPSPLSIHSTSEEDSSHVKSDTLKSKEKKK